MLISHKYCRILNLKRLRKISECISELKSLGNLLKDLNVPILDTKYDIEMISALDEFKEEFPLLSAIKSSEQVFKEFVMPFEDSE